MTIDHLQILDLISRFTSFTRVISLTGGQKVLCSCKSNGQNIQFAFTCILQIVFIFSLLNAAWLAEMQQIPI
jgi:hypothetical protein